MTVTLDANGKAHDRRGRFSPLPRVLLRDCPPIPTPRTVEEEWRPNFTPVPAARCQHRHFRACPVRGCPGPGKVEV